jgi:hypothetical protein
MLELQVEGIENSGSESMDVVDDGFLVEMPITVDPLYNLVVCNECGIGIPFEWVKTHLKGHHKIWKTEEEISGELNVDEKPMTVVEAKSWIKSVWVGRAVQGIPVMDGLKCKECEYSGTVTQVMRNHVTQEHKVAKMAEQVEKCKVQLVFKGGL